MLDRYWLIHALFASKKTIKIFVTQVTDQLRGNPQKRKVKV